MDEHVFGPVPSRRLGRSIGINNIPPKICTYSCVYCQLGRAIEMTAERRSFFDPETLIAETARHLEATLRRGEVVDYLTIVPDGEPTLDAGLGRLIRGLGRLGVPVALITNSSLLGDPAVRADLAGLDWVSVKIDAADEATWRRIDRPHRALEFEAIIGGRAAFAAAFHGTLTTETMLVNGLNDEAGQTAAVAEIAGGLHPAVSYVSIPTRPPALDWVKPAAEQAVARAYAAFSRHVPRVENLVGYEGNEFSASGDARADLLGISAVHPMRRDAVEGILAHDGAGVEVLDELLEAGELVEVEFGSNAFYVRGFRK